MGRRRCSSPSKISGRGEGFVQVHHFKWDSTVLERLKEVSETEEDYTFWEEYKKMYNANQEKMIEKINIDESKFGLEEQIPIENEHWDYQYWNRLTKGNIKNLKIMAKKAAKVEEKVFQLMVEILTLY